MHGEVAKLAEMWELGRTHKMSKVLCTEHSEYLLIPPNTTTDDPKTEMQRINDEGDSQTDFCFAQVER